MIFQWFGGTYKDARSAANFFGRFAVEADMLGRVFPEYKLPREQRRAFLFVGRKTATRHNMAIGDRVTLVGDIFPVTLELTVRGIYDAERNNENLFFHYKYLDESLSDTMKGFVSTFFIRMQSADETPTIAKSIDDMFRNSPMQTKTETEKAFELSFLSFLGNVKAFLLAICTGVTFTILLVSGNTMAMAIRERVREVGILKTLGFTRWMVFSMIIGESITITLVGGGVGLSLASGLCSLIREAPLTLADMSGIHLSGTVLAMGMMVALAVGLLSSMIPAYRASRRPIIEILKATD
jgi:putative ABC transport system permease protein